MNDNVKTTNYNNDHCYSREGRHGGELDEDVLGGRGARGGLLWRRQLVLGAECLGLEDVILSDHPPVTLVSHHQHGHLGGGEISLNISRAVNILRTHHHLPDIFWRNTRTTSGWRRHIRDRSHHSWSVLSWGHRRPRGRQRPSWPGTSAARTLSHCSLSSEMISINFRKVQFLF